MAAEPRALTWVNAELVPTAEAQVPADDLGFLFGAACFETMRWREGCIFRLAQHLDRLERGLRQLGTACPSRATLRAAIEETVAANGLPDARVRLTVTAGGAPGVDSGAEGGPTSTVLVSAVPADAERAPARLMLASVAVDAARPLREAKTANFLPYWLARREALAAECDEAVLLNAEGRVVEAATANLFVVADGRLRTPALEEGPLPGVTRAAVLELARALGVTTEEGQLTIEDLDEAEELFLTGSIAGVWPVAAWRGSGVAERRFEHTPGPLTARLSEHYERLARSECP